MMQFLEFTFRSFWHFCGILMLMALAVQGLVAMAAVLGQLFRRNV